MNRPQRFLVRCAVVDAVLLSAAGLLCASDRIADWFVGWIRRD